METPDLDAVEANERACYTHPWSRTVLERSLSGRDHCFVCEVDDRVAGHGLVSAVADEGHILNICIAPSARGRGLGREFLLWLLGCLGEFGATTVFLEVRRSNFVAIGLYESVGFNEIAVRRDYYPATGGQHEDARVFGLTLDPQWPTGADPATPV